MMITIHQRNRKVSQRWWHCQQICSKFTSLSSARQIYHWPAHNFINFEFAYSLLLFHPSMNIPLFKKSNVLLSLVIKIYQWTDFQYQIPLMSKFPVLSISLFSAESGKASYRKVPCFYQQSLGMIQTLVTIFLKSPYSLDDKIRTTVQLITYTVLQKLSVTFHNSP